MEARTGFDQPIETAPPGIVDAPVPPLPPLVERAKRRREAVNATSPWEKWMMFRTPKSKLKPTAIRA
ncbi:hypothetical protein V1280_004837 [Bradyrhizobium sp. AZCC 2230]